MTTKPYGYMQGNQITINRGTIKELNIAIADLEERGFEVVKRDETASVTYGKNFNYNDGRGSRYKYKGDDVSFSKCTAVMRRIMPIESGAEE